MEQERNAKKPSAVKRLNLIPRIVCFLFAFIMWIYVMVVDSPDYEQKFESVPITVTGTTVIEKNSSLSVFSGTDISVDVTVKGQKSIISRYSKDDIKVEADVSGVTEGGRKTFALTFDLPSGLSLISSSATTVDLFIDRKVTLDIDVKAKLSSYKVATDFELGQITCDPSAIRVEGPDSVLRDVKYAYVDVGMNDSYISESFVTDGTVALTDSDGNLIENRYLKLSQNSVKVNVPVYTYKELTLTAATKYGFFDTDNSKITFDPPAVRVKGDPTKLASVDSVSVTTLDEKMITEDTTFLVDIVLPDGLTLADGEPNAAKLSVKRIGMSKKSISVKDISVNAPEDMKYELITNAVAVTVIADDDIISDIKATDIKLTADISNFGDSSGNVMVPATVEITYKGGTVYELGEYSIQVIIE